MTDNITLAQLATELAQLRQQIDEINQRLDMIYGAVTRLADQKTAPKKTSAQPAATNPKQGSGVSMMAMMEPGHMLDALYEQAVKAGLDISYETLERLKEGDESDPSAEKGKID